MLTLIQAILLILGVVRFFVIAHFIMSWLLRFEVLNIRQEFVGQVWYGLERILDPIYSRVRRVVPDLGGIDLSPIVVLRRIFVHTRVDRTTLLGAISVFLLLAVAFEYAFLFSAGQVDGSFFNQGDQPTTSFMYFSLVTITTLGYGDLSPAHEVGKFLATAEAVIGQVFLVTVVARLVSLYGMSRPDSADQPAAD